MNRARWRNNHFWMWLLLPMLLVACGGTAVPEGSAGDELEEIATVPATVNPPTATPDTHPSPTVAEQAEPTTEEPLPTATSEPTKTPAASATTEANVATVVATTTQGEAIMTPATTTGSRFPHGDAAIAIVSQETGIAPEQLKVITQEEVTWPNSALGCPQPGMSYLDVLTPGVRVLVEGNGETFHVHGDGGDRLFLCEDPQPPANP